MGKGIKKRLKKRIFSGLLAAFVAVSTVSVSYCEAKAEAVTMTWGIVEVLQAIFASVGVTYMTKEMLTRDYWTDGANALDDDWSDIYDSMEESYEKQWTVINGGGGSSGGDPTPTPDPDDDKKTIPHFADLIRGAQTAGMLSMSAETYSCLLPWLQQTLNKSYEMGQLFCDKTIPNGLNVDPSYISGGNVAGIFKFGTSTHVIYGGTSTWTIATKVSDCILHVFSSPFCFYKDPSNNNIYTVFLYDSRKPFNFDDHMKVQWFLNGEYVGWGNSFTSNTISISGTIENYYKLYCVVMSNWADRLISGMYRYPVFNDTQAVYDYMSSNFQKNNSNKEPIWTTPELQESYENNGSLELPSEAPDPINIPSIDAIADLAAKLNPETNPDLDPDKNPDPEIIPNLIQEYINGLKPQTEPDPEPTTAPDPEPTTTPEPIATPEPDDPNTENSKFIADLKSLFPFCIPFDLIHALDVLNVPGEAPVFKIPFKIDYGDFHVDEKWEIDFSDFESVVDILRVMETLGFIVGLAMVTRNLIKG